jgi:hypothetical protein
LYETWARRLKLFLRFQKEEAPHQIDTGGFAKFLLDG